MITVRSMRTLVACMMCLAVTCSGCTFQGLNSLPLPGTVGRGSHAQIFHVEVANVGALEPNSPVMIGDVVVGTVDALAVKDWHADVRISVKPDVVVPANAAAAVGQTSLLGSMHLALDPPIGQAPRGHLQTGATIGLERSSTYPSTEQTLSSLAVLVNGGGLGQIGDIVREFNAAFNGRQSRIRDLLARLLDFVGTLDAQRGSILDSIGVLNRLAGTLANQSDVITAVLHKIPPAMDILIQQRPRIVAALDKFRVFSTTASGLVHDTGADLVANLTNLEPTLRALADVGPDLATVLAYAPTFPYTQNFIDRAIRGDYMNLFMTFDFTVPRLKRGLFLGTRWGQEGEPLVPAPGDPWYATYTFDPMKVPVADPPTDMPTTDNPALAKSPQPGSGAQAPQVADNTPGGR